MTELVRAATVAAVVSLVLVGSLGVLSGPVVGRDAHMRAAVPGLSTDLRLLTGTSESTLPGGPPGPTAPALSSRAPASGSLGIPPSIGGAPAGEIRPATIYETVTFEQIGLVLGTSWSVVITDVGTVESNQTSASVALTPGTYSWQAEHVEGYDTNSSGTFDVALRAIWISVVFHGILFTTYPVTFRSPGIPPTVPWTVTLRTGQAASSANSSLTFYEANGTYGWTIGNTTHLLPSPSSGAFRVNGTPVVQRVYWSLLGGFYEVQFNQTGLPPGVNWSVDLNGSVSSAFASPIAFVVPNGSYPFTVESPPGFEAHPGSGTAVVAGDEPEYLIEFGATIVPAYSVTFIGEGLPPGAPWTVTFAGITLLAGGPGVGMRFVVPNGTYSFSVGAPPQYVSSPPNGTVVVAGASPPTIVLAFVHAPVPGYAVEFTELGLPAGTPWFIEWDESDYASTNTSVDFSAINGTYSWLVTADSIDLPAPASGTVTVSGGAPSPVLIRFAPPAPKYPVTFTEVGLAAGTLWSVSILGVAVYPSENASIEIDEPNGSYDYRIGNESGLNSTPWEGSFSVAGDPVAIRVAWSPVTTPFLGSPTFWLLVTLSSATVIAAVLLVLHYRPPRRRITGRTARRLSGEFRH